MPSEPASGAWWEPTWRRLVGSTVVLFLVILAFLVGRVRAGADPGLAREATQARQQQTAPSAPAAGADPRSSGADPTDPSAPPQADPGAGPGANGTTDNFGNAVPDQGAAAPGQGDGTGPGPQGADPPSTHVS
jgi:hypothetical protein